MNAHTKLGFMAAMILSAVTFASSPAFAGNPHWGVQQLEQSRAKALRARCMDAHGRCIESQMLGDNYQYRCRMQREHTATTDLGAQSGWVSAMFCE